MKTLKAIEHLKAEDFPNWWVYNIVQDKKAFSASEDQDDFNGNCNRGLSAQETLEKWESGKQHICLFLERPSSASC